VVFGRFSLFTSVYTTLLKRSLNGLKTIPPDEFRRNNKCLIVRVGTLIAFESNDVLYN